MHETDHYSPQNAKELFNLCHSSLWNAIERIFGVLKNRFHCLNEQLEYPYEIQVQLVNGICCLHNLIRIVGGDDLFDEEWAKTAASVGLYGTYSGGECITRKTVTATEIKQAKALRDRIAEQMWTQYSQFKRQNRLH